MDIQELYKSGKTFQEFISLDAGSYKEKMLKIYNNIQIDSVLSDKINDIHKEINVLIFGEIWCPDCVINIPALKKICDINNSINMRIVPRDENEQYVDDYKIDGKIKMPTFIFMDAHFKLLGTFIEIPKVMRKILANGNQVDIIVAKRKYTKGEFTKETIEEILKIIG